MRIIDKSVLKSLKRPNPKSHKGQNGRLLVMAGSEKYHGSLLYAIKAAAKVVDLVYVLTTKENRELVKKLKEKTAEFIPIHNAPFTPSYLKRGEGGLPVFDCVLIGPGMGKSRRTYNLVRAVLKSKIKAVLDADALNVLDVKLLRLLGPQHILTPHRGELNHLLSISSTSPPPTSPHPSSGRRGIKVERGERIVSAVKNFVKKYGCTIVLKGRIDIIAQPSGKLSFNKTSNEGMTKGGTGDVLAGLIAAFFCRNDAFTSAATGVYVNGAAGDELYKKVGPFYDAEDLVEQIPKMLWRLVKHKS